MTNHLDEAEAPLNEVHHHAHDDAHTEAHADDSAAHSVVAEEQRRWDEASTTGERDLADRAALSRGVGLSTQLQDITEVEYRDLQLERVILVGVWTGRSGEAADAANARASMDELRALAETAGSVVLDTLVQRRAHPDAATYVGSGKVVEIGDIVQATGADTVVCDGELSAGQLRNLEERLKVKVVDRTALILDIFAQHARSREGKAQVELAQLKYFLPRLRGWGVALSRQRGGRVAGGEGIGSRGPGETKLEIDKRRIGKRISQLKTELVGMLQVRDTKRAARLSNRIPAVAIAGYTNAGKSSLLNRLTGAGVLVDNSLFATLDPTTRRTQTVDGRVFTLTDTVGFVRHLPHQLIDAFRSTLEEVADADLIVHVVDGADPHPMDQIAAVREVLAGIDAGKVPELIVVNKVDIADPTALAELRTLLPGAVLVSTVTGEGLSTLTERITELLPEPDVLVDVLLPYTAGSLVARVHSEGTVLDEQHTPDGTRISARVRADLAGALRRYTVPAVH
ncbi:MAG: GTPase HflX [Nakamurella sp.]